MMTNADRRGRTYGESARRALRRIAATGSGLALLAGSWFAWAEPPSELRRPGPNPEVGPTGLAFLVAAYAVIWLVTFGFVLLTLRRQRRLEQRIGELGAELAALERGAGREPSPADAPQLAPDD